MGDIKVLDRDLIGKIAAGEVIERPASIIKELIENSIDAKSKKISIEIEDAGKKLIKVSDDGKGMDAKDLKISFKRHTTSKLRQAEDLYNIKNLGFRGEALASMAAVSHLRMTSKTKKQKEGVVIEIEDEKIKSTKDIGCNTGTTIEIEDLFYNTPARKKFLKRNAVEYGAITDIVTRYALIHKDTAFKMTHNGKATLNSPKTKDTLTNISNIYSEAQDLVEVDHEEDNIVVKGFVSIPALTRSDKNHMSFYVNKRFVKSAFLNNTVHDAYHTMLNVNRHPIVILDITLDPKEIDVNVHPSKKKIKFEQEGVVYSVLFNAVKAALMKEDLVEDVREDPVEILTEPEEKIYKKVKKEVRPMKTDTQVLLEPKQEEIKTIIESKLPELRILGVIQDTYFIAEYPEGIFIIDQHAIHERVNYERLMRKYEDTGIEVQSLMNPEVIKLSPVDSNIVQNNLETLKEMGFEMEAFGDNSFVLRTVPIVIGRQQGKETIMDIIDDITNLSKQNKIDHIKEKMLITISCRSAIKAHDEITTPRIRALLDELGQCENPYTCPHGRPTIIKFTLKELEKKFRRVI